MGPHVDRYSRYTTMYIKAALLSSRGRLLKTSEPSVDVRKTKLYCVKYLASCDTIRYMVDSVK